VHRDPGTRRSRRAPDPYPAEVHGVAHVITRPTAAQLRARLPRLVGGLGLVALGIALSVRSELGADPWTVFHEGVSEHTPLSIGQATTVVGLLVFVLWLPLRQRPGIGTPINALGVGLATDGFLALVPGTDDLAARIALLAAGTVVIGVGIGCYLAAHLGTGPRDGVMVAVAARGLSLRATRTAIELTALVAGFVLGGTVGIGTAVLAFGVGPIGQATLRRVDLPVPGPGGAGDELGAADVAAA
jgi:uncharacterized membrane protein YczE